MVRALQSSVGASLLPSRRGPSFPQAGASVMLKGLALMHQRTLNGKFGVVVEYCPEFERWLVRLEEVAEFVMIAVEYLSPSPHNVTISTDEHPLLSSETCRLGRKDGPWKIGDQVRLEGLSCRSVAHLNGLCGVVVGYSKATARWKIIMDSKLQIKLRDSYMRPVVEELGPHPDRNFSAGEAVMLHSFRAAHEKMFDNTTAQIIGRSSRPLYWVVNSHFSGETLLVRSENLRKYSEMGQTLFAQGDVVQIEIDEEELDGVEFRELNGCEVRLLYFDDGLWRVLADDGSVHVVTEDYFKRVKSMFPSPARAPDFLAVGDRVRIVGLRKEPDLNGLCGELVAYSPEEGRWLVHLDNEMRRLVGPQNIVKVKPVVKEDEMLTGADPEVWQGNQQDRGMDAGEFDAFVARLGGAGPKVSRIKANIEMEHWEFLEHQVGFLNWLRGQIRQAAKESKLVHIEGEEPFEEMSIYAAGDEEPTYSCYEDWEFPREEEFPVTIKWTMRCTMLTDEEWAQLESFKLQEPMEEVPSDVPQAEERRKQLIAVQTAQLLTEHQAMQVNIGDVVEVRTGPTVPFRRGEVTEVVRRAKPEGWTEAFSWAEMKSLEEDEGRNYIGKVVMVRADENDSWKLAKISEIYLKVCPYGWTKSFRWAQVRRPIQRCQECSKAFAGFGDYCADCSFGEGLSAAQKGRPSGMPFRVCGDCGSSFHGMSDICPACCRAAGDLGRGSDISVPRPAPGAAEPISASPDAAAEGPATP